MSYFELVNVPTITIICKKRINCLVKKVMGKQCQTLFFGAPKSLQMVTVAMKLKDTYSLEVVMNPWKKVMTNLDSISKAETLLCQQRSV